MRAIWVLAGLLLSCSGPTFDPPSLVTSVRILATRAEPPYAQPGGEVDMKMLAVDGRSNPREPMRVSWLKEPCINPQGDSYYNCFPRFGSQLRSRTNLDTELVEGDSFSVQVPADVIESHVDATGQGDYGVVVVFSFACAGHVQYLPELATSPDAVPFACIDSKGRRLTADEFVFAYSLLYVFRDRTNENPTLRSVTNSGMPIDSEAGLTVPHCDKSSIDDCSALKLDVDVPSSSQEVDPGNIDADGHPLRESLYAKYYATAGKITNDVTIIFDARKGRLDKSANDFFAPREPGTYDLWAVIYDNRGGAVWEHAPLIVE